MDKKITKDFWSEFEKTGTKIVFEMPEFSKIVKKIFVKDLRKNLGFTQQVFANSIGVTKKAVEKWEQGINPVSGPTARLMYLLNDDNDLIQKIYKAEIHRENEVEFQFKSFLDYYIEDSIPFIQKEKPVSYGISFENIKSDIDFPENKYNLVLGGNSEWTKKTKSQSSIC